ncbi:hypothetical protein FOZ62_016576, partial [Perkinsus olseni]
SWVFDSPRFRRFQPTKWCAMHRAKIERIRLARVKREADERAARRMSPRFVEDDSPYKRPLVPPGRRSVILRSRKTRLAGRRPHFRKGRFELGSLSDDERPGLAIGFPLREEKATPHESDVKKSAAAAVKRPGSSDQPSKHRGPTSCVFEVPCGREARLHCPRGR